ncbi:MAG TPA: SDR family oxidoreductase [Baekduia sp.]|nr:SDR family oxidoreductase [Baekduia sp.]
MSATLITGATGFLGAVVADALLERGERVVALVRAGDDAAAELRMDEALAALHGDRPAPGRVRLQAVCGDLTAPRLGLRAADRDRLRGEVTAIVHCGASISFDLPLDEARAVNVGGTCEVLELAAALDEVPRLVHVSTAYVAGRGTGIAPEAGPPPAGHDFRNTYEQTKAEAERLLQDSGLPAAVARPSIVVGETGSGWTSAFNVLYWPLQAFARGLLDVVPGDPDGVVDTIGVDAVAAGIVALLDDPAAVGVHTLAAGPRAATVADLAREGSRALGRPAPRFSDAADLGGAGEVYVPYFDVASRFATDRGDALLARTGVPRPPLGEHLDALVAFAQATRWGRRPISRAQARAAAREQALAA